MCLSGRVNAAAPPQAGLVFRLSNAFFWLLFGFKKHKENLFPCKPNFGRFSGGSGTIIIAVSSRNPKRSILFSEMATLTDPQAHSELTIYVTLRCCELVDLFLLCVSAPVQSP